MYSAGCKTRLGSDWIIRTVVKEDGNLDRDQSKQQSGSNHDAGRFNE